MKETKYHLKKLLGIVVIHERDKISGIVVKPKLT